MPKSPNQKLKLLYLMEIMLQQTDERHPMTVPEMISQLAQRGVSAEERSGKRGTYTVTLYGPEAQRFILDNLDAMLSSESQPLG